MTLKDALLYIWQLPQNLMGFLLILFYGDCIYSFSEDDVDFYQSDKMPSGISLGKYVILRKLEETDVKHEFGHTKQSKIYGWLYLLIIGLPSLLGNIWDQLAHKKWTWYEREKWYYHRPWEAGADKRGGVKRFEL